MGYGQIFLILSAVILNSVAQLVLKAGTNKLGVLFIDGQSLFSTIIRVIFQPYIISGLVLYVVSFGIWIIVLSKLEVSIAYPLLSIGYIIGLVFAWYFFGEMITINKTIGIFFIVIGTYFITR